MTDHNTPAIDRTGIYRSQIPAPPAPHPDSLRDPALSLLDSSGARLIFWCPRNHCGAIYHTIAEIWCIEAPITFGEFVHALHGCGFLRRDTPGLERWLRAGVAADELNPLSARAADAGAVN